MGRGPKVSFADTERDRLWEKDTLKRQQKRRRATVWDAVAGQKPSISSRWSHLTCPIGRVGQNGFLSNEKVYSEGRDTISSSTRPISALELLYRRKHARARDPDEVRPETVVELPMSDLSSALHRYVSKFYAAPKVQRKRLHFKSMDFSALIAMSILMEEAVVESLGESGHLAFLEAESELASMQPLFWNGKKWAASVLELPGDDRRSRVPESENDSEHLADTDFDVQRPEGFYRTSNEGATTEIEPELIDHNREHLRSSPNAQPPIQPRSFVSSRLREKLKGEGLLDLVEPRAVRGRTIKVAPSEKSSSRGPPPAKRRRISMSQNADARVSRGRDSGSRGDFTPQFQSHGQDEGLFVTEESDVDMERDEGAEIIAPQQNATRARSLPSRRRESSERSSVKEFVPAVGVTEDENSTDDEHIHRESSYRSILRQSSRRPSIVGDSGGERDSDVEMESLSSPRADNLAQERALDKGKDSSSEEGDSGDEKDPGVVARQELGKDSSDAIRAIVDDSGEKEAEKSSDSGESEGSEGKQLAGQKPAMYRTQLVHQSEEEDFSSDEDDTESD